MDPGCPSRHRPDDWPIATSLRLQGDSDVPFMIHWPKAGDGRADRPPRPLGGARRHSPRCALGAARRGGGHVLGLLRRLRTEAGAGNPATGCATAAQGHCCTVHHALPGRPLQERLPPPSRSGRDRVYADDLRVPVRRVDHPALAASAGSAELASRSGNLPLCQFDAHNRLNRNGSVWRSASTHLLP